jgi:hypothetical protein
MTNLRHQMLVRAREIITDRRNWTRFTNKRRYRGNYRYCAWGAVQEASRELTGSTRMADTYHYISLARLIGINDGLGHRAVLLHMDWLIEKEKAKKPSRPRRIASPGLVPAMPKVRILDVV